MSIWINDHCLYEGKNKDAGAESASDENSPLSYLLYAVNNDQSGKSVLFMSSGKTGTHLLSIIIS